jgi:urea transport system substrate-binding protein
LLIYTPFGYSDWYDIIKEIKGFSEEGKLNNKKTAVISTINGDANIWFYQELAKQNMTGIVRCI